MDNATIVKGTAIPNSNITFRLLLLFSPLILMSFMIGAATMSGTPFVFLLYFFLLILALLVRHLSWLVFGVPIISTCGKSVYIPNYFTYHYKEFMTTFIFMFTISYIFGPYFNWKYATVSSLFMLIFFIIYAIFDFVIRIQFTKCIEWNNPPDAKFKKIMTILGNVIFGGALGALSQMSVHKLGLSKYLYYSSDVNRPTKKVFRCGKMKR